MLEILYDVHVWPEGQPVPHKLMLCAAATLAPRVNKATVEIFNCIWNDDGLNNLLTKSTKHTLGDDPVNGFSAFGRGFKGMECCWVCLSLITIAFLYPCDGH